MNIYGYGCYPVGSKNPYRSTIYKVLRGQFLPKENIILDVMGDRSNLNELVNRCDREDAIVIINRRTFGGTTEFRRLWQEVVINRKINLLIVDENSESRIDYYSSCDYSFVRFPSDVINEKWERLQKDVFEGRTNTKAGRKSAIITSRFVEVYWYYQHFYVKVDEAYANLGVSKSTFYNLCKEYEETEEYVEELNNHPELHNLPKRGGVTKEIELLLLYVERMGRSISEACESIGIRELTQIEYNRYKLAKAGGRKEQFRLEEELHQDDYLKTH